MTNTLIVEDLRILELGLTAMGCLESAAIARDARIEIERLHGEIGEARQSFKELRMVIDHGAGQDAGTIAWVRGHLDALYLPKHTDEGEVS